MANEDPAGIPEQIRQNRPFFLVLGLAVLIILFGESLNRISLSWYVKGDVEPSDTFYMIQVLEWVLLLGLFVILCVSGLNELG